QWFAHSKSGKVNDRPRSLKFKLELKKSRLRLLPSLTSDMCAQRIENTTETLSTVEQERRTTKHILNLEHGGDFVDVSACKNSGKGPIGRARELLDGFTSQRSNAGVKRIKLLVAYRRREIPPSELRTGSDSTEPIAAARTHGDIVGDDELIAESRVENGSRGERSGRVRGVIGRRRTQLHRDDEAAGLHLGSRRRGFHAWREFHGKLEPHPNRKRSVLLALRRERSRSVFVEDGQAAETGYQWTRTARKRRRSRSAGSQ
ncbi:hypothetical protein C8R45DRAFT_1178793, partial [Mycena sanguinolenta]